MNRRTWLLALAALFVFGLSRTISAAVDVKPDGENVVAGRLAGAWEPDPVLTLRLGGPALGPLAFRVDPKAVADLPEKYDALFKERPAYLAGVMTLKRNQYPFVLTERRGNPRLIYFRPRGDEAPGDAEGFNVMLAAAADPAGDLLFIGGDVNNRPFSAYRRAGTGAGAPGAGAAVPGGEPGAAGGARPKVILDAGTQADADAAVETVTRFLELWAEKKHEEAALLVAEPSRAKLLEEIKKRDLKLKGVEGIRLFNHRDRLVARVYATAEPKQGIGLDMIFQGGKWWIIAR